jgi:hypothetical protein
MSMYSAVLTVHSWLRWVVLLAGLIALARSVGAGDRPWTPAHERAGRLFGISLDLQFLLGALLYFVLSPFTQQAFDDFGAAMRVSPLRFWAVEHVLGMTIGMALTHIGRARIRKATSDRRRHRLAVIFFGLALLVIVASIPWPGMPNGRPLFRW